MMSTDGQQASEADDGMSLVDEVIGDIATIEARLEELEAQNEQKDERIEELESKVEDLDQRTDMLQLVEEADSLDGEQRSVTLLQHLHRKAKRDEERGRKASAVIDRTDAEEALHYPDLDRTTFYDDMRRCVRLVDNEDVCRYEGGEVVLDLTGGDLDPRFTTGGN